MNKLLKHFSIKAMILILFCSGTLALSAADYKLDLIKRFYSIGTATINGTYYPVGNSIARTLSSQIDNIVVVAEPTAGSVANLNYLQNKQIDFCLVQSDTAWQAYKGSGIFKNKKFRELKILASLYSEVVQIVVKKNSQIKTIEDLKGCKISVGSKESGSAANAVEVLTSAGLNSDDYELVYERFTRSTESLRDGYIDAVYYTGGLPADGILRLAEKVDLRLVNIPPKICKRLVQQYPYFSQEEIPAGIYEGQANQISTIGLRALFATTDQISTKFAGKILSIIYQNSSEIAAQNKGNLIFRKKQAFKGTISEMLHPGAIKYFATQGVVPVTPQASYSHSKVP
ncbi:MAG: TAXI family TRAP transporter solute-binding subunit [Candidatus Rifleibacteriota bacterium]